MAQTQPQIQRDTRLPIDRRRVLSLAGGVATTWLVALPLAGCGTASRTASPAAPALQRLVLLPTPRPEESIDPPARGRYASSSSTGALGTDLAVMAVTSAVDVARSGGVDERRRVALEFAALELDLASLVTQGLAQRLTQRQLDYRWATHVAAKMVPAGTGAAYVQTTVDEAGFYHSWRAGGYSPELSFTLRVARGAEGDDPVADLEYSADWRTERGNPRHFTTPASMTLATARAIAAVRPRMRELFETTLASMLDVATADLAALVAAPRG